ncbi:hypothetical protein JOE26_000327 [Rhodococcus coprophilus]|uniref:Uncharacterized protein n=1 Tax=Rhodococcus coprophilus TaxID=38310 RepID=A0A2X4TRW5_9NOCA|nr:hypothetical protein [Rhodococcus coprophilus]SQI30136.1 Uncharacterised protein [Rhodococcus coprophilus]
MTTTLSDREPENLRAQDRGRVVLVVALVLVAAQVTIRAVLAGAGEFYWDDLILIGRAGTEPLLSESFLRYDHDGHLMPGAFLVAGLATALAPLQWWPAATTLVLGQAIASLAVLRVLWLLLGARRVLWAPLLFYLLTPLTLPAFAWWAAALNSLPLQAALAWVTGDALQYARTGRRRHLVSGVIVTALSLFFFEKAILVPFVAFAALALTYRVDGRSRPIRTAARRAAPLWLASALILAIWLGFYVSTVESRFGTPTAEMARGLSIHGLSYGLLPALVGGPLQWARWNPGPPWADPPAALVFVAWAVLLGTLAWSLRRRQRTGFVWAATAAYVAASMVAMISTRFGPGTTYELAQTLRYFADSAVVVAIAAALVLRAPRRPSATTIPVPVRRTAAAGLAALFTVSSLWSTVTFTRSWTDNPTGEYLAHARDGLTSRPDVAVLDHPVSVWVLLPVTFPHNLVSSVFAALPDRSDIAGSTTELRVLDEVGALVPADLLAVRWVDSGPEPGCGRRVEPGITTMLPTGPMLEATWTVQLNYLASSDGEIEVGFPSREPARVAVTAGPSTVYVRVPGGGEGVQVRTATPGLSVCIGAGPVGVVVPR